VEREEILEIALETGFMLSTAYGQKEPKLMPVSDSATLIAFANAIAAHEREDCAEICDTEASFTNGSGEKNCAAAIRARGNK
jgi:hypothetical protein